MIVAISSIDMFNVIYCPPACLLTANICSLIYRYIVNNQECFKIITMVLVSRNHQIRRTFLFHESSMLDAISLIIIDGIARNQPIIFDNTSAALNPDFFFYYLEQICALKRLNFSPEF